MKKIAFKIVDGKINFLAIPQIQEKFGILTTDQKRFAFIFDEDSKVDVKDFEVVDFNFDFNVLRKLNKNKAPGKTVLDFLAELNSYFWWPSPKNMVNTQDVERNVIIDGVSTIIKEKVIISSGIDEDGKSIMVESLKSKTFERMSTGDLRRMCNDNQVLFNGETVSADELIDFKIFGILFFPRNERLRNSVF